MDWVIHFYLNLQGNIIFYFQGEIRIALNKIISVELQYLKLFNCEQIKLWVLAIH